MLLPASTVLFAILASSLILPPACGEAPIDERLTLSQNGATRYRVVIATNADAPTKAAADELVNHLEQITGADFRLVTDDRRPVRYEIVVGPCQRLEEVSPPINVKQLQPEEYIIRTVGTRLIIVGGPRNGTLNGVYVFLEDILGCRWYTPDCSVIPKEPTLRIAPLNIRETPRFEARILIEHRATNSADPDWAARMRLNGSLLGDDPRHQQVLHTAGPYGHSLAALLPASQYFDTHPEYFSEINGQRIREHSQVCMTSEGAIQACVKQAKQWLAEDPTAQVVSVSHNDWYNYCQCPSCRAASEEYGVTGAWLRFVNAIAEEIEKDYPDVLVDTFAYEWTVEPPRNVKPRHNVVIRYAPIYGCSYHAYDDPNCALNVQEHSADYLKRWCEISPRVWIWYYMLDGGVLHPSPLLKPLQQNFALFDKLGVKGFSTFQLRPHGPTFFLHNVKSYLAAKLMWDPSYDVDSGIEEFCRAYYGPAAEEMLSYIEQTQDEQSYQLGPDGQSLQPPEAPVAVGVPERIDRRRLWNLRSERIRNVPGFHGDFVTAPAIKPKALKQWDAAFERMERQVANDPTLLARVQAERASILWCCLLYLPPDDPVHIKAQKLFLPIATKVGVMWIPDLRSQGNVGKLWLNEENIKMLRREFPEFCPPE